MISTTMMKRTTMIETMIIMITTQIKIIKTIKYK